MGGGQEPWPRPGEKVIRNGAGYNRWGEKKGKDVESRGGEKGCFLKCQGGNSQSKDRGSRTCGERKGPASIEKGKGKREERKQKR